MLYKKFIKIIGSRACFCLIISLFIIESAWIALSARYPMAFDEAFHLGIIKLYATQWSPFFSKQAPLTSQYGALTTDPSYLYHYFMSFAWRLANVVFVTNAAKIISLRFINIALFGWGLVLFRKLLLRAASAAIVNTSLLFFILVPIVPLLAGQINYDNLIVPLVPLTMLLALRVSDKLKNNILDVPALILAFSISLLASLVVFVFLPILTAITLYLIYSLIKYRKSATHPKSSHLNKLWLVSWRRLTIWRKISLSLVLVISLGLFIKSYGVDVIVYHNLIPQCNQVLGIKPCTAYAPWNRNYNDFLTNHGVDANPIKFSGGWLYGMYERLIFTINGPGLTANYANPPPLPILDITAGLISVIGLIIFLGLAIKLLAKHQALRFMWLVSLFYLVSLWGRNYHDYIHLGQMVAINGRYLIPLLPFIFVSFALGYQRLLRHRPAIKSSLLIIGLLLFLQGGGAISYIYASNNDWYWPNDSLAQHSNATAKKLLQPWIVK